MTPTSRDVALDALVRVEQGAYSNVVLPSLLRTCGLDARDRAFVTGLVYGALRRQRALDAHLSPLLDRPLAGLDPEVRAALRLGAQQLDAGVSPHAAVAETVDAVVRRRPRASGFVNAVLRRLAGRDVRGQPRGDDLAAFAIRESYPDWLVARLVADLGEADARAALVAANRPPAVTLRPNPRRTTAAALRAELEAGGVEVAPGEVVSDAAVVRRIGDPAALPAVAEGRATPQDQGSQAVVVALDPRPGERVLEVAAAPGGKATAIGERVGDGGLVVALDLQTRRLGLVREAARRLALRAVSPLAADGRRPPLRDAVFDRVLVDAPCSGLGVLRRRPEARWRVQPDAPDRLAALQRELLAAAAPLVRPGGTLAYSVCTLTRAETVDVDEWVTAHLPDLVALAPPGAPWRAHGRGALLPPTGEADGMYLLRLERVARGGAIA